MRILRIPFFLLLVFSASTIFASSFRPPFQGVVTATLQPNWFNVESKPGIEDFIGKQTVLFFWTSSCVPCLPLWQELQAAAAKPESSFQVIGVHSGRFFAEHDPSFVRAAIRRYGIKVPVVDDAEFALWRGFGVASWPTLVLLNIDGYVSKTYAGVRTIADLEKDILALKQNGKRPVQKSTIRAKLETRQIENSPLRYPSRIAVTENFEGGVALFVSDSGNNRIVVVRPSGHILYTVGSGEAGLKDGSLDQAQFSLPSGITVRDQIAYVADTANHAIRRIDFKKRTVDTLAGTDSAALPAAWFTAPALKTSVPSPLDVQFYPNDEELAIAVAGANQIWGYRMNSKVLRRVAGGSVEGMDDGSNSRVTLAQPTALFTSPEGTLFFIDANSSALRTFEKGVVTTLVGQALTIHGMENGPQSEASMQYPQSLWVDKDRIFIADGYNHAVRVYDRKQNLLSTLTGRKPGLKNGPFFAAQFDYPTGIARVDDNLYICDSNNHVIRVLNLKRRDVSTLGLVPASSIPRQLASVWEVQPSKDWNVAIDVEDGWKLQIKRGSRFILTEEKKPKPATLYQAPPKELSKTKFLLPPLSPDAQYRLQATFYFCSEGKNSLCTAHSVDSVVVPTSKGASQFTIALKP
jgi:thiol-disulfide isomerase/thioredoxin